MASKRKFICEPCGKEYLHKSKYARHLESSGHKMFMESCMMIESEELCESAALQSDGVDSQWDFSLDEETEKEQGLHMPVERSSRLDSESVFSDDNACDEKGDTQTESSEEDCDDDFFFAGLDSHGGQDCNNFYPFQSKLHALSYILTISPRPMGETNLRFIFYIFQESSPSAPSYAVMKKYQLPGFTFPKKNYTSDGIPFYVNSPKKIVEMCMGSPGIATKLARLPVQPLKEVREMFHAKRWMEDPRFFAPMMSTHAGHVFIGDFIEYSYTSSSGLAKILQFLRKEGIEIIQTRISPLKHEDNDSYSIQQDAIIPVDAIVRVSTAPQHINGHNRQPLTREEYDSFVAVHKHKERCNGKECVILPLILYTDDLSGNKSKQWNKFDSWCITLAGLPKEENHKLQNIHFVCCTNKCSILDISLPVVEELIELEETGILVYDAHLHQEVIVFAPVMCIISDNPRHSELMSHMGPTAKHFCRMCMASRDNPGIVLQSRSKEQSLEFLREIETSHTEREKKMLQTKYGLKNDVNPMLNLPVDLHRSTPVETLHTILLGPYKYLLRSLMTRLTARQKDEVLGTLASFNFSGFKMKLSYRVCRYYQSLVGRDFKALAQCALFLFKSYFTSDEKKVWLALSKVFKMTYCDPFILNDESKYRRVCTEFVQTVLECAPFMAKKVKVHLILHLVDNMTNFGPTSSFNTERCEAYNSLIRMRNIIGNKQAPSRDIATGFARLEHLRFVCCGGTYNGQHSAGEELIKLYHSTVVQKFINGTSSKEILSQKIIYRHGTLRKISGQKEKLGSLVLSLYESQLPISEIVKNSSSNFTFLSSGIGLQATVRSCKGVMSIDGELIEVGNFVRYNDQTELEHEPNTERNDIGLLVKCFQVLGDGQMTEHCIVRPLYPMDIGGDVIQNEYDCPILSLSDLLYTLKSNNIVKAVSVVHECTSSCVIQDSS